MNSDSEADSWKSRLVYMLIVIVVGHVVCWGPVHLSNVVIRLVDPMTQSYPFMKTAMNVSYFLENISGCINPIAFCFMSKGFRSTLACLVSKIKNKIFSNT